MLETGKFKEGKFNFDAPVLLESMENKVNRFFKFLKETLDKNYENVMIPTLFKIGSKCQDIFEQIKKATNEE